MKVIGKCQEWNAERRWLVANDVDITGYHQERTFQDNIKEIQLMKRAEKQKIQKGLSDIITAKTFEQIDEKKLEIKQKYKTIRDMLVEKQFLKS